MMKKEETKNLQAKPGVTEKDLREKILGWRKELFDLKLSAASSHIKDNSQFKKLRHNIARALTQSRKAVLLNGENGYGKRRKKN